MDQSNNDYCTHYSDEDRQPLCLSASLPPYFSLSTLPLPLCLSLSTLPSTELQVSDDAGLLRSPWFPVSKDFMSVLVKPLPRRMLTCGGLHVSGVGVSRSSHFFHLHAGFAPFNCAAGGFPCTRESSEDFRSDEAAVATPSCASAHRQHVTPLPLL
ncbi:hypothetical protein CesoFtcFv8_019355 [Champsocephalus esox]|uniref:Uncharacterized protein n=1 Tax=Champsocephalus esox TaxID=159716 RepID=A0AAN8GN72_9TELE|nr:hypothetical protein CesoFtcFv8_019355 [Champsocephalus esox]